MANRGAIYCEEAYAQGKMLDNSEWRNILPRNITPSDIDIVFDNAGSFIYGELSSQSRHWNEIATGQRLMYWNAIRGTQHLAILCKHSVPRMRQIDTVRDIEDCCVMYDAGQGVPVFRAFSTNEDWRKIVGGWHKHGADWVRDRL